MHSENTVGALGPRSQKKALKTFCVAKSAITHRKTIQPRCHHFSVGQSSDRPCQGASLATREVENGTVEDCRSESRHHSADDRGAPG